MATEKPPVDDMLTRYSAIGDPSIVDVHPPVLDTPLPASGAPSFMDDPVRGATPLPIPNPSFLPSNTARNSVVSSAGSAPGADSFQGGALQHSDSQSPLAPVNSGGSYAQEKQASGYQGADVGPSKRNTRTRNLLIALSVLILLIIAIVLGVYFGVVRHSSSSNTSSGSSNGHSSSSGPKPSGTNTPSGAITYGGDGTLVTTENGSTFTYTNKFGGYFVKDDGNPWNNGAKAQSWTPALNQSWTYGKDKILGVNLGGWLVLEPFITPSLYQKYPTAIDEWTLSRAMAADTASGGLKQLEDHYKTFITEEDFAQIAGAGLNWVRLPIPFWAIDTWNDEPFLSKTCWTYALKAFDWARKYGIRILLDLHAAPGSQNAYNHSGQFGKVNLLNGVMGVANAQRLLHYIRIFTEFIAQPQYKDVIPMFGIVNEPTGMDFGPLSNFYIEAHRMIRNITGVGAGNGPYISIQGGNNDLNAFVGTDRIALEQHPYFAFDGAGAVDVVPYIPRPCSQWGNMMNTSQTKFGVTTAAEFSLGFNDCGFMLHSTADDHTTKDCTQWDQWENYTPTMKQNLMTFAMANMDALQHWFFWTWKIGPKANDPNPRSPLWSYKLGLDNGWIPKNPRDSFGTCASLGVAGSQPFDGNYQPWQTGGPGTDGVLNAADQAKFGQWPPASIGGFANAAVLPTYTPTGPVPTLPTQTYPAPTATAGGGDGWFNDQDTVGGMVAVNGCSYPNPWDAIGLPAPAAACTGTPTRKREPGPAPVPVITPA